MLMRILLLLSVSWVIGLTNPLFTVLGQQISGRDLEMINLRVRRSAKPPVHLHAPYRAPTDPT